MRGRTNMENFEELLQAELDKLFYTKHLDHGQYNDGQLAGFELGARWALKLFDVGEVCPNCGKNAEIVDEHRECNYCGAIT
jgi:hypothetical protein